MKTSTKLIALICALSVCTGLVGCGDKNKDTSSTNSSSISDNAEKTTENEEATTEEATEAEVVDAYSVVNKSVEKMSSFKNGKIDIDMSMDAKFDIKVSVSGVETISNPYMHTSLYMETYSSENGYHSKSTNKTSENGANETVSYEEQYIVDADNLRYYSNDEGKTWTVMELTKDFEDTDLSEIFGNVEAYKNATLDINDDGSYVVTADANEVDGILENFIKNLEGTKIVEGQFVINIDSEYRVTSMTLTNLKLDTSETSEAIRKSVLGDSTPAETTEATTESTSEATTSATTSEAPTEESVATTLETTCDINIDMDFKFNITFDKLDELTDKDIFPSDAIKNSATKISDDK